MVAPMMPPPLPTAFGPPPAAPMGMGGGEPTVLPATTPPKANPETLLAALKELVGTPIKQQEPIYRPGYKKPKRPDYEEVRSTAKKLYENNREWRNLVYVTLMWVHQELTGVFDDQTTDSSLGNLETYISTRLSAERNLIISKFSGLQPSFQKRHPKEELRGYAQRLEDFALWMRDEETFQHSMGNRPLEFDEGTLLFDYGLLTKRHTLAPERTDCPVAFRMIDPAQVHPVWGPNGLEAVYRVYRDSAEYLARDYGDFTKSALKTIEDKVGKVGDSTEIELIEYWDSWNRCVLAGETVLLPWSEHKYGDVPWTVQYGAYGDPMFTRTPGVGSTTWQRTANGAWSSNDGMRSSERRRKSTPYLYFHLKNHELTESVNALLVTALKKEVKPAVIRYRSNEAAEKDLMPISTNAGDTNDAMLGDEKIEPVPTFNVGFGDRLQAQLEMDYRAISSPPEMAGRMEKSNVTGVAQAGANDAGMHLISPLAMSMERAMTAQIDVVARMLGNFGYLSKYKGDEPSPLIIPNRKAKQGQPAGYEFDREVIEKVGSRVHVSFTKIDPRDWAALFAAGGNGVTGGFVLPREIRAIATGDHDYDTFFEEWQETNSLMQAQQLPEFQKLNVASSILEKIKENEGNPEIQDGYRTMFQLWQQIIQPPPQQPQMGMGGGMPPQGAPPQGGPQGALQAPFPPPDQSAAINPGVPGQVSYPSVGAGPGGQGAPVGRPY